MDGGNFTFGGRHITEFNCFFRASKWPVSGAPILHKTTYPGRHGSIRFPGHTLKEKSYEGVLHMLDYDNGIISDMEMMERADEIGAWLQCDERQPLILDAKPTKYYLGEVESELSLEAERWTNGSMMVKFALQPFAYAIKPITARTALTANSAKMIEVRLPGTAPAPINVQVTAKAALSWLQVTCGGKFVRLENLGMSNTHKLALTAVPERYDLLEVTINGNPAKTKMTKTSAEPFAAAPGRASFAVIASGACDVEISLQARWR